MAAVNPRQLSASACQDLLTNPEYPIYPRPCTRSDARCPDAHVCGSDRLQSVFGRCRPHFQTYVKILEFDGPFIRFAAIIFPPIFKSRSDSERNRGVVGVMDIPLAVVDRGISRRGQKPLEESITKVKGCIVSALTTMPPELAQLIAAYAIAPNRLRTRQLHKILINTVGGATIPLRRPAQLPFDYRTQAVDISLMGHKRGTMFSLFPLWHQARHGGQVGVLYPAFVRTADPTEDDFDSWSIKNIPFSSRIAFCFSKEVLSPSQPQPLGLLAEMEETHQISLDSSPNRQYGILVDDESVPSSPCREVVFCGVRDTILLNQHLRTRAAPPSAAQPSVAAAPNPLLHPPPAALLGQAPAPVPADTEAPLSPLTPTSTHPVDELPSPPAAQLSEATPDPLPAGLPSQAAPAPIPAEKEAPLSSVSAHPASEPPSPPAAPRSAIASCCAWLEQLWHSIVEGFTWFWNKLKSWCS